MSRNHFSSLNVPSRRKFLGAAAMTSGAVASAQMAFGADLLRSTPSMALGPFYPIAKPLEADADLTRLAGHSARAKGKVIDLSGRVLDRHGMPVAGATIELWQANAVGRYMHHGDTHDAPLDPDFQGYAQQVTDADGRYRFLTIIPGAYPAGDYMRAKHIHFDVRGKWDRLVTQMYFRGDPLLGQDKTLSADVHTSDVSKMPEEMYGHMGMAAAATPCQWAIVLRDG